MLSWACSESPLPAGFQGCVHDKQDSQNCICVSGVCVCACACVRALSRSAVSDSLRPLWMVAHQAPLSTDFPGENPGVCLPLPPPGDLPNPGTEPISPLPLALQANSFLLSTWEAHCVRNCRINCFVWKQAKCFMLFPIVEQEVR